MSRIPHVKTTMGAIHRAAALCVAAALNGGCAARVNELSAEPRHVCPGQQVEVKWSVSGSATLTARPPARGIENGAVPDEGRTVIAPTVPTDIVLEVTRFLGSPSAAIQTIEVQDPGGKREVLSASMGDPGASAGCDGGKAWATVHVKRFAADIKVATVSLHEGDPRSYDVDHEGVHDTIAAGAPSTAFSGKPIAGDWLLTAHLVEGQVCRTPTIQNNVVIDVTTQCQ